MKMNKNIIKQITGIFMLVMLISACSKETQEVPTKQNPEGESPIELDINTKALEGGLECDMYVFCKEGASNPYKLRRVLHLTERLTSVNFSNDSLTSAFSYRFLFVATPPAYKSEMKIKHVTNPELALNDEWKDLLMEATKQTLSDKLHYGIILNKTGESILNDGQINISLERLVGKQIINIYKVDAAKKPMDVSNKVWSVLDRVHQIDIEYTGLTKSFTFGEDGTIKKKSSWGVYKQTINPTINEAKGQNLLKVQLPQPNDSIDNFVADDKGTKIKGSARIRGVFGLPSNDIKIKSTFSYYHTTPIKCAGTDAGNHTKDCFEKKTLELNLPPTATTPLLKIISNTYTMNKAGLWFDRVIDVGVNGQFVFNTEWAK